MKIEEHSLQEGHAFDKAAMEDCFLRTKNAAYDIIQLKGLTDYAVAAALVRIIETIVRNENTLLTVSSVASHVGVDEVCLSVPTKVNRNGADHVLRVPLDEEEKRLLLESAKSVVAKRNVSHHMSTPTP